MLEVVLGATTAEDADVHSKAVRLVANKLFPRPALTAQVDDDFDLLLIARCYTKARTVGFCTVLRETHSGRQAAPSLQVARQQAASSKPIWHASCMQGQGRLHSRACRERRPLQCLKRGNKTPTLLLGTCPETLAHMRYLCCAMEAGKPVNANALPSALLSCCVVGADELRCPCLRSSPCAQPDTPAVAVRLLSHAAVSRCKAAGPGWPL